MQPVDKLGKYDVQGTIGRGAVGVVYAAFDPILARPVAIKAIPLDISDDRGRERHARFKREAQAVARMHHPHIVSIFDYGETEELAYIVMERLEGGSLKARIERHELKLPEVERIMRDLLNGLHHSHMHGVVHRDIKPANVVFDKDGDLKITDFGVARLDNDNLTKEGSALGTPAYMSPEQVRGEAADSRADIYAAGVLLFEMLSGRRPFEGSAQSVMFRIISAPAPTLASLSLPALWRFEAIVARALAKSPIDRFSSAAEMWQALTTAFIPRDGAGDSDTRTAPKRLTKAPSPTAPVLQRLKQARVLAAKARPGPLVTAGSLAIGAIALAAWLLLPQTPQRPAPQRADVIAALSSAAVDATPKTPAPPSIGHPLQDWRDILKGVISTAPCSLLAGDVTPAGEVVLTGLTGLSDLSQIETAAMLRRALNARAPIKSLGWHATHVDGPYCSVFLAVRPFVAGLDAASSPARMWVARAGSQMRLNLDPAPITLVVDRFTPSGQVIHLRSGEISARGQALGEIPLILDVATVAPGDLVVASGWSLAVAMPTRPKQEESTLYLAEFRTAIERARQSGAAINANVISVVGSP